MTDQQHVRVIFLILVLSLASCRQIPQFIKKLSPSLGIRDYENLQKSRQSIEEEFTGSELDLKKFIDAQVSPPTDKDCQNEYDPASLPGFAREKFPFEKGPAIKDAEKMDPEGMPPPPGGNKYYELPKQSLGTAESKAAGYYRFKDADEHVYGTKRTLWRLTKAGKLLAKKGITMGIGEMSSAKGKTAGHKEHQAGQDVDMRFISDSGMARACKISGSSKKSCFNREKTFEMIKTLIDIDPTKVDKFIVSDDKLVKKINDYMKVKYKRSKPAAKKCNSHDNHIHASWKS
jgi:hypothetical protein